MKESGIQRLAVIYCFTAVTVAWVSTLSAAPASEADKLNQQAEKLSQSGRYAEAVPLVKQALALREKTLGPESPYTAQSVNDLALLYDEMADYARAEPLYLRALKIYEKTRGPEQEDVATILNNLALLYHNTGRYTKAEPLFERSLQIRQKVAGPEHPSTAATLNNLGLLCHEMGNYPKAESYYQRALKIYEKARGAEPKEIAATVNNLAQLYFNLGNYAKAEPLYQRALMMFEKSIGPEQPRTAVALGNLARLYTTIGDFAKAEPLYQRALKIYEKTRGPAHPDTATGLDNLAGFFRATGDYSKAETLYQRAFKIREKALGPEHADTARSLANLASLAQLKSDYAKAIELGERALKIREKALHPQHPDIAANLNDLALVYDDLGEYTKEEALLQRALNISVKALGPRHPSYATNLDNLADLYVTRGDYTKAKPLLETALAIREKILGPEHQKTASSLHNLGFLYYQLGDYTQSERLYQRTLQIFEKVLGPEHADMAAPLNNMALLYRAMGDYEKAQVFGQRALEVAEKTVGPDHPHTARTLGVLAYLQIAKGNLSEALNLTRRARQVEEMNLSAVLSFTSEQERLAFRATTQPYNLPGTLGDAREMAETVLRQKGVVLESLLEDRLLAEASIDPKQRETIERLRTAKQQLMQLQLAAAKDSSGRVLKQREAEKANLFAAVQQLEGRIARQVSGVGKARAGLNITVDQVQSSLLPKNALIEFVRYGHYLQKREFERRYGAVLITHDSEPLWIPLGSAAAIEKNIQLYQKSVRGQTTDGLLNSVLHALHEQLWAPIEKSLPPDITTVILSPDGQASFVSFAALPAADEQFVAEKYSIQYVASGRDILKTAPAAASNFVTVFANPDFAGKVTTTKDRSSASLALRSAEMRDIAAISFPRLPGTALEATALQERIGTDAQLFVGVNATEAELRKISSPRVLHLATHGFFLAEMELGADLDPSQSGRGVPRARLVNPMHRSGLALAGAQGTFAAWARGEVPAIESDGVVTAEEVGGLSLKGTELVVLSACDTGSGEAHAGEGVMGLRRGFVQAGAKNLLMTLWPISDETTVNLMLDFYAAAFKTRNAPQALADVQRDWLVKLRKEKGLLAAVRLAGPFIMSSQGKP